MGHARVPVTVRLPLNVVKQIDEELDQRIVPLSRTPSYTIVAAATNHPELLDRASWRRFQIRIKLPLPKAR